MNIGKRTIALDFLCLGLVLMAYMSRIVGYRVGWSNHNSIIFVLYTIATLIWLMQINRRISGRQEKSYLICTAVFIIMWMACKTIKYNFTLKGSVMERYLWYIYYIPQTFIVLMVFFAVLYIGMPEDKKISRWWNMLYIPAGIISIAVMTNDIHQNAFIFPGGVYGLDGYDYTYGPVYFASVVWLGIMFAAILVAVMIKCSVSAGKKRLWVPLIPLIMLLLYFVLCLAFPGYSPEKIIKVPEMISLCFASFIECLIITRFIPSNDGYEWFWENSGVRAGIMDNEGRIVLCTGENAKVAAEEIERAIDGEIMLDDGVTTLNSRKIRGGYGYRLRDISEILEMSRQMEEMGDILAEENAMIEAENQLAERKSRIAQQEKIYGCIAVELKSQIDEINEIINGEYESEDEFINHMKYACVLNVYMKRYTNLFLLAGSDGCADLGELFLAIEESLTYIKACDIQAYGAYSGEGRVHADNILSCYRFFENVIEWLMPELKAIMVDVIYTHGELSMRIEAEAPNHNLPKKREPYVSEGLKAEVDKDDDTWFFRMTAMKGGDVL